MKRMLTLAMALAALAASIVTAAPGADAAPPLSHCTIFPADNYWHADVRNLPVLAQSNTYVNSIGRNVSLGSLGKATDKLGWTRFSVPGFAQEQQVRLRSLAYADGTVRPVFEANVVDVKGGSATAYTAMVDAVSGKIIVRQNKVDESSDAFQFQGAITATDCGPKHQFELTDDNTKQIVATAAALVASSANSGFTSRARSTNSCTLAYVARWPPIPGARLFARRTIATAFQRIIRLMRRSISSSPGKFGSCSGEIVLM